MNKINSVLRIINTTLIFSTTLLTIISCSGNRIYPLKSISDAIPKNQQNPEPYVRVTLDSNINEIDIHNNCRSEHMKVYKISPTGDGPEMIKEIELMITSDCFRHVVYDTNSTTKNGLLVRYKVTPFVNERQLPKWPVEYHSKDSLYFRQIEAD